MPPRLTASQGAFQIDGRPAFLLSGEMHYFRVKREDWEESLRRIRALGIQVISTYIPWVWHEPDEGHFDFTGATHPNRDLLSFLTACRDTGLAVMARPGPLIYAEFEGLGVPLWLGSRYPESVVVRRDGSQDRGDFYYNHSLLHPVYRARVKRWYEAVVPALLPFFNDPVLSFQIDNETGLLFANRIGDVDFNLDTVARYRAYLETTYGTVAALNDTWQAKHPGFDRLQPPKPPLRQPEIHDWQQFLELWICRYLIWLRGIALDLGVTVPLTHNEQGLHHSPAHVCDRSGLVDFIGYDLYPKASPNRNTLDFPFATTFYPALFANYSDENRPLWGSEIGAGWMDSRAQVSEEAIVQNAMGSVANGARGMNLFPIHDGREPVGGSEYRFRTALDVDGRYTPRARTVESIGRFLEAHGERLVTCQLVRDPVAFGVYYPNFHFAADEYVWGTVLPDPHRYLAFLGQGGLHAALVCCGFSPRVVDLGEVGSSVTLDDLRCVVWSSKGYLDEATYREMVKWVGAGGHLVTAPIPPTCDLHGRPAPRPELFPVGASRVRSVDQALSLATMAYGLLRFWIFHRSQLREEHLSSGHVIELYEPLLHLLQTPARGVPFAHPWGAPIAGDYRSATFDLATAPAGVQVEPGPLSRPKPHPKLASSYQVHHGLGSATTLGTQPAGRYVTPRYYEMSDAGRRAMRQFFLGMLKGFGVEPNVETDLELECVPHLAPDGGGYLFLVNRLERQTGRLRLRRPQAWGYRGHARVAFSFLGSGAVAHDATSLDVDMAPQDVLVVSLPPA